MLVEDRALEFPASQEGSELVVRLMAADCIQEGLCGASGPFVLRPWCFSLSLRVQWKLWCNTVMSNRTCPDSVQKKTWVWVSREHEELILAELLPPRSPVKKLSEASQICKLPPWPEKQGVRAHARGFNCLVRYWSGWRLGWRFRQLVSVSSLIIRL